MFSLEVLPHMPDLGHAAQRKAPVLGTGAWKKAEAGFSR